MDNQLLKMEGITKYFPGVRALFQVNLEVGRGEAHALIGENGAGKSTLMKILLGLYSADGGTIEFKGRTVHYHSPAEALKDGISMIHQEISLVMGMTVEENIWLGRETLFGKAGLINKGKRREATKKILDELGIHIEPDMQVSSLSVANMQLVELARAVSYNSDLIIMDEPTSALTNLEVELLYKIVGDLLKKGISVIFISHKLNEIFRICSRITVLRDGCFIASRNSDDIEMDELVNMIAGREMGEAFRKPKYKIGNVALEAKHLCSAGIFEDISFKVHKGEVLGFMGLMGAGRTEIMRAIFGIDKYTSGEIYVNGKKEDILKPSDAVRLGIGMVTEDRLRTGIIPTMSVLENSAIASMDLYTNKVGIFRMKKLDRHFSEISKQMSIKYGSVNDKIGNLSGGNQQKVILSRWLSRDVDILIMDEPTRGIDVGAKEEIYHLIDSMVSQRKAVVLISSEMPELLNNSDRILVIRNGRIVYECSSDEADGETLIAYAFGTQKEADR